ncbi:MAG: glycosyltransferase family 2 protein [Saprospiraceae bacterium]|nr:glycosyltransferase family 2 protein [Saprospiraceae bacterium]
MSEIEISVVVCVYNEQDNVKPLIDSVREALKGFSYELIYVDDGSTDNTLKHLQESSFHNLKIIELRKNYGQSLALMAGIDAAAGEYIVTMDGDLQNDPFDIPHMLKQSKEGNWDLVAGIRKNRKDGMLLRKLPSKIANYIIRRSSGVAIKDYGCTLKLFKKEIAKDLGLYGELHRFIPVLANLEGATISQMEVKHHARTHGESKYGMGRTIKVMSDLVLMLFFKKYLQRPMHLFGNFGVIIFVIGVAINLYMLFLKFQGQDIWGKPLMLVGILFVLTGIQLITFGIFVELQMRTYYESQNKKPYQIRNIFEPTQSAQSIKKPLH